MNCTILGTGSGIPHPDYHHSSLVIQTTEGSFLTDCGEGTARQLLRHSFNKDFLDAILISHYHPDHVSGVFMVLQMLYLEGRTKPLYLFLPERLSDFLDALHMFYTFEQRFPFVLKVHENQETELFFNNVNSFLTDHLTGYEKFIQKQHYPNTMNSFGFIFQDVGKKLVYTSDCNSINNLRNILDDADLVIMDGLHPDTDSVISFLNSDHKRLLLIHGISESTATWLRNNHNPLVTLARENDTYEV